MPKDLGKPSYHSCKMYDKLYKKDRHKIPKKWWDLLNNNKYKEAEKLKSLVQEKDNQLSKMVFYYSTYKIYQKEYDFAVELDKRVMDLLVSDTNASDLAWNVKKSCIDAFVNKLAKTRPKATFLTKDGTDEEQRVARNLDTWVESKMKKAKVSDAMNLAFLSSVIGFYGSVKVERKNDGMFRSYLVHPVNFFVKDPDVKSFRKKEMGERKEYRLYELIEKYPKEKAKLLKAYHSNDLDLVVEVFEMYKSKKARAVFTDKVLLEFEKWNTSCPYRVFVWKKKLQGMIGTGICEELVEYQERINDISSKISKSMSRLANTRVYIDKASGLKEHHFTGNGDDILFMHANSKKPVIEMPSIINPQYFHHLDQTWTKAHEQIGVSEIYATGDTPKGIESGVGVRAVHDQSSARFSNVKTRYEDFAVEIAKLMCELSKASDLPAKMKGVNLKERVEHLSVYPANMIPETPAGQLETFSEFMESGLVSREEFIAEIDSPDIKKYASGEIAMRNAVDKSIERAVDKGEEFQLDDVFGLDLSLNRLRHKYARLVNENDNERHDDKLAILLRAISVISQKIQAQKEAQLALQQSKPAQPGPIN